MKLTVSVFVRLFYHFDFFFFIDSSLESNSLFNTFAYTILCTNNIFGFTIQRFTLQYMCVCCIHSFFYFPVFRQFVFQIKLLCPFLDPFLYFFFRHRRTTGQTNSIFQILPIANRIFAIGHCFTFLCQILSFFMRKRSFVCRLFKFFRILFTIGGEYVL